MHCLLFRACSRRGPEYSSSHFDTPLALGSSLQHHGVRLMGNDKDLPAHSLHHHYITTLLFLYSNGHDECFRGSHMHFLVFHRLQHTVRPCSTFRWKGIATSVNRSPYMYSCVTQWAYLSQLASTVRFHWEQLTVH